jgi:hypothetical protein
MHNRTSHPVAGLTVVALILAGLLAACSSPVAKAGSESAQESEAKFTYQPGPVGPFVALDRVREQWNKVEAQQEPKRVQVKGIYITSYSATNPAKRDELLGLIERTELNAVVVNVKDDWGNITIDADIPLAREADAIQPDLGDGKSFTAMLHEKQIYAIARIVTFKDAFVPKHHTELAVASTAGGIWKDYNGVAWLNPYNRASWDYIVSIARAAAMAGFDEIQFDYVRFPTDGNMSLLSYPGKDGRERQQVIADFLAYARKELRPYRVWVSADMFGLVTSLYDDLGIGQHLEEASASVDYLSPMVYPSHYIPGNLELPNPNAMPYETVHRSMLDTKERWAKAGLTDKVVMRPWLQDFSWGYPYGTAEVRAQIQATYDAGYKEWLLWNAANEYTEAALKPAGKE